MTIIVWDGETLASDSAMNYGDTQISVQKLFRCQDGSLVGGAGTSADVAAVCDWLINCGAPGDYPQNAYDVTVMRITPEREILMYCSRPVPIKIIDKRAAIGSGVEAALALLETGITAAQAVCIIARKMSSCGGPVQEMRP